VAEKVFARQLDDGLWQWRSASSDGHWLSDVYHTGDNEALAEMLRAQPATVYLVLAGQQVVSTTVEVEAKEKRHLAKLLPYELEEQLIEDVDDIHLSFLAAEEDRVNVIYAKKTDLQNSLHPLSELGCDVRVILPDYLLLIRENNGATLVWDGDQVIVRLSEYRGFTVDHYLASRVIKGQDLNLDFTASINLVAESQEHLREMEGWLPEAWTGEEGPEISRQEGGFWDWVETGDSLKALNMRRGTFSRQLPFQRWLELWKVPVIAAAAAYFIAVGVAYGQYQSAKAEQRDIVASMNDVYLKAVPNGRPGDPEGRLRALVKRDGGGGAEPTNLMVLINGVAETLKSAGNINISSFRYNSDQRELMLNIEGGSFGELESLRNTVEQKGFKAELLRVETRGDKSTARMKVAEAI